MLQDGIPEIHFEPEHQEGFGATHFVPLTEAQFACLGKIVTIFSAIEMDIEVIIMTILGLENWGMLDRVLEGRQFGAKVAMVRELAEFCTDKRTYDLITAACNAVSKVQSDRNDAVHGTWGYLSASVGGFGSDAGRVRAAARNSRKPEKVLLATDLDEILVRAEVAARAVCLATSAGLDGPTPVFPLRGVFAKCPKSKSKRPNRA